MVLMANRSLSVYPMVAVVNCDRFKETRMAKIPWEMM